MSKPIINKPTWATAGTKVEPTVPRKSSGFTSGETVPFDVFNWQWYASGLWLTYLDEEIADGFLEDHYAEGATASGGDQIDGYHKAIHQIIDAAQAGNTRELLRAVRTVNSVGYSEQLREYADANRSQFWITHNAAWNDTTDKWACDDTSKAATAIRFQNGKFQFMTHAASGSTWADNAWGEAGGGERVVFSNGDVIPCGADELPANADKGNIYIKSTDGYPTASIPVSGDYGYKTPLVYDVTHKTLCVFDQDLNVWVVPITARTAGLNTNYAAWTGKNGMAIPFLTASAGWDSPATHFVRRQFVVSSITRTPNTIIINEPYMEDYFPVGQRFNVRAATTEANNQMYSVVSAVTAGSTTVITVNETPYTAEAGAGGSATKAEYVCFVAERDMRVNMCVACYADISTSSKVYGLFLYKNSSSDAYAEVDIKKGQSHFSGSAVIPLKVGQWVTPVLQAHSAENIDTIDAQFARAKNTYWEIDEVRGGISV